MRIYLDANVVIYAVENTAILGAKAIARIQAADGSSDVLVISDLTRLECRCQPMARGDTTRLREYDLFFGQVGLQLAPFNTAVFDRATEIRASHNFKLGDSLHLAAAVESGCLASLTNDSRLARFPDLAVEVLA
jgi:predicted nucleic acid-binding protein